MCSIANKNKKFTKKLFIMYSRYLVLKKIHFVSHAQIIPNSRYIISFNENYIFSLDSKLNCYPFQLSLTLCPHILFQYTGIFQLYIQFYFQNKYISRAIFLTLLNMIFLNHFFIQKISFNFICQYLVIYTTPS